VRYSAAGLGWQAENRLRSPRIKPCTYGVRLGKFKNSVSRRAVGGGQIELLRWIDMISVEMRGTSRLITALNKHAAFSIRAEWSGGAQGD
jgi:hypothetical protein